MTCLIMIQMTTHSKAQGIAGSGAILKYRFNTGVTNNPGLVKKAIQGKIEEDLVDWILNSFDTVGSSSLSQNLQSVLIEGDSTNRRLRLGKFKSLNPYSCVTIDLHSSDSSGHINVKDSTGNLLFDVSKDYVAIQNYLVTTYIKGSGSNPIPIVLPACGIGATASCDGNDMAGNVTLTTGVITPGSTTWLIIPFQKVHTTTPRFVIFYPANSQSASLETVSNVKVLSCKGCNSGSAFELNTNGNLANSTTYVWYYQVFE